MLENVLIYHYVSMAFAEQAFQLNFGIRISFNDEK